MNTPKIETPRLLLRRAFPEDIPGLFEIYKDPEVMRFVPVFPAENLAQMEKIYQEKWAPCYQAPDQYQYVICLGDTGEVIGYIHIDMEGEAHDLGYGLRRDWWRRGVASEAAKALVARAQADGVPFVTATHDRENPHSGFVMAAAGLRYRYSYREQWMPKNIPVVFRLYQRNLDGREDRVFGRYRQEYPWFVEEDVNG